MNRYGQIDDYTLGNGINTVISYDQNGLTDKIETKLGSTWIQNWDYDFDPITGNMEKRTGLKSGGSPEEEEFTYDDLNRLRTYTVGNNTWENTYDPTGTGNLAEKSDIGTYNYSEAFTHRLNSINDLVYNGDLSHQSVSYTKFNKVFTISDTLSSVPRQLSFTYGPDEERVRLI